MDEMDPTMDDQGPALSIVVPVYNGADTVASLVAAIEGLDVWSTRGLALNESDATGLTVLVAVGGRDDPPAPGAGVWKSTDGGNNSCTSTRTTLPCSTSRPAGARSSSPSSTSETASHAILSIEL